LRPPPARLAEVDVAGQLAENHDVEPGYDIGLERRRCRELGIEQRGPQIGKKPERLAHAEDALLRAQRRAERFPLRARRRPQAAQRRIGVRARASIPGSGCFAAS
jgi:hypothetical protein